MTAQEYIESTLKSLAEPIQPQDIGTTPLEDAIFAKVMSKKFRKWKADEQTISVVRDAIKYAVENDQPLQIGQLFGGNKLWRFAEAPEADWAELFGLIYRAKWAKTITSVYPRGVDFEFYGQDVSVEYLNNLKRSETDRYAESFKSAIQLVNSLLPQNLRFTYKRHSEVVDGAAYEAELDAAKEAALAASGGSLPVMGDAEKKTTELNVRLLPGQDKDPDWREKVELQHGAIFATKSLVPYLANRQSIACSAAPFPGYLAIGANKRSIAKFWASVGVLEQSSDGYDMLVLSPKQVEAAKFDWQDVKMAGLMGKNFSKIRVVQG
ncbi:MAG TPA: hypothetical protein VLH38_00775 [Patescibacteria group bacterium]|nr:hypothetical protein [Patescibacteria group bacterium]